MTKLGALDETSSRGNILNSKFNTHFVNFFIERLLAVFRILERKTRLTVAFHHSYQAFKKLSRALKLPEWVLS